MKHVQLPEIAIMAISPDERAFFVELGNRIAELRKARGITQAQMADALGVSQQTVNSYEVARRRVPTSALPVLAELFSLSLDELVLGDKTKVAGKRGPTSKLQHTIEQISTLPRSKQKLLMEMIDAVLKQG